jgi:Protein of Unknown function (DUF2784)
MIPMLYRALADLVIVVHFAFIAFAVAGAALLLIRRLPRWFALTHIACSAWASYVMFSGRICPLTLGWRSRLHAEFCRAVFV